MTISRTILNDEEIVIQLRMSQRNAEDRRLSAILRDCARRDVVYYTTLLITKCRHAARIAAESAALSVEEIP